MSKFESEENRLRSALNTAYSSLDAEVGRIKRLARDADCFSTGSTVAEIANASKAEAKCLAIGFGELFSARKRPWFCGKEKFDKSLRSAAEILFSEFCNYCYTVINDASEITKQKHMYGKEYPELHKSLEAIKLDLARELSRENS